MRASHLRIIKEAEEKSFIDIECLSYWITFIKRRLTTTTKIQSQRIDHTRFAQPCPVTLQFVDRGFVNRAVFPGSIPGRGPLTRIFKPLVRRSRGTGLH